MEKYSLKNRWIRIALALLLGGMLQELMHTSTGKDNSGFLVIGAIFFYLVLSFWIYFKNLYDLNKMVRKEELKEGNDSLIDN